MPMKIRKALRKQRLEVLTGNVEKNSDEPLTNGMCVA